MERRWSILVNNNDCFLSIPTAQRQDPIIGQYLEIIMYTGNYQVGNWPPETKTKTP